MLKENQEFFAHIPTPADRRIALRINPAAERALRRGHPWLFRDAIEQQSHPGKPGDLAVIFDTQRKFLAIGLFDPTSSIRVRILQHHRPAPIGQDWFAEKLAAAVQIRSALPTNTTGYRLVHGENDGLPGLVVDRYAQALAVKLYTAAWIPHLPVVVPLLQEITASEKIILRISRKMRKHREFLYQLEDGSVIDGDPSDEAVLFLENGITFEANLMHGQKTGFFLDQRDNRARVEQFSRDKRVLNLFAYSGGFSVYAARGGAKEVISVDLSQPALEAARRNFDYNRANTSVATCRHKIQVEDAFEILQRLNQNQQIFDMVIIDPPSFAKSRAESDKAKAAYQRLTRLSLGILAPGGILVQASCSSRVQADEFFEAIHQAGQQAGKDLKEIERSGHALDHPVGFPEGEYLKCLFART